MRSLLNCGDSADGGAADSVGLGEGAGVEVGEVAEAVGTSVGLGAETVGIGVRVGAGVGLSVLDERAVDAGTGEIQGVPVGATDGRGVDGGDEGETDAAGLAGAVAACGSASPLSSSSALAVALSITPVADKSCPC